MTKGSNLPAKKYKAGERTVTRLSFEGTGNTTQFIDVGLALSAINQRFYRSGLYYYISSIEVYNNEQGVMDIHTAPDNYAVKTAWNLAFRKYMEMNRLAPDTERGMWHDFRVYLSDLHRTTGSMPPVLYGPNSADRAVDIDETGLYSMFTTADDDGDSTQEADNFYCHLLGPHVGSAGNWSSIGAITSYGAIRSLQPSQVPLDTGDAQTDPLANLFDMSSEEMINDIIGNLVAYGDQPPYDRDQLQGETADSMCQVARIGTEIGLGRVGKAAGFCAPYGLICLDPQGMESAWRVVINLVPGTYHGVHAERSI